MRLLEFVHFRVFIASICVVVAVWASAPCALQYLLEPAPLGRFSQTQADDGAVMKTACVCFADYATGTRASNSGQALLPMDPISSQPCPAWRVLVSMEPPLRFEEIAQSPDVPVPRLRSLPIS